MVLHILLSVIRLVDILAEFSFFKKYKFFKNHLKLFYVKLKKNLNLKQII